MAKYGGRAVTGYVRKKRPEAGRRSFFVPWEQMETPQSIFGASAALSFHNYGIAPNLVTEAEIGYERMFGDSRMLSAEEATTLGQDYGLSFDEPIPMAVFEIRRQKRREELSRQSIIGRGGASFSRRVVAPLTGSIFGAIADPVNIAASFVPVVGQARYGAMASKMGVTRARLARGGIEGLVGAAGVEPFTLLLTQRAQADYTMYDSLANIALGAPMGAGFHYIGGKISDFVTGGRGPEAQLDVDGIDPVATRIAQTDPVTRREAMRTAIADAIAGRPIDVEPVLRADPAFHVRHEDRIRHADLGWDGTANLSPENLRRIGGRFRDPVVFEGGTFKNRKAADAFIKSQVAEGKAQSGKNFVIERMERGDGQEVVVHQVADAPLVRTQDGSSVEVYSTFQKAQSRAKKLAAQTGKEHSVIALRKGRGRKGQQAIVARGIDQATADRISQNPIAVFEGRSVQKAAEAKAASGGIPPIREEDAMAYAQRVETGPSALSQEARAQFDFESIKGLASQETDPDKLVAEAMEGLDDIAPILNRLTPEERAELDAELKQADADIALAERQRDMIERFGKCMGR
jgi:hypothetical protein